MALTLACTEKMPSRTQNDPVTNFAFMPALPLRFAKYGYEQPKPMSALSQITGLYAVQLLGIFGTGGLFDAFVREDRKAAIGRYMMGKVRVRNEFEAATISGILEIFGKEGDIEKISLLRVAIYSLTFSVVLMCFVGYRSYYLQDEFSYSTII